MNKNKRPLSLCFGLLSSPLALQIEEQGRQLYPEQLQKYEQIRNSINYLFWHHYISADIAKEAFTRLMMTISRDCTLNRKTAPVTAQDLPYVSYGESKLQERRELPENK